MALRALFSKEQEAAEVAGDSKSVETVTDAFTLRDIVKTSACYVDNDPKFASRSQFRYAQIKDSLNRQKLAIIVPVRDPQDNFPIGIAAFPMGIDFKPTGEPPIFSGSNRGVIHLTKLALEVDFDVNIFTDFKKALIFHTWRGNQCGSVVLLISPHFAERFVMPTIYQKVRDVSLRSMDKNAPVAQLLKKRLESAGFDPIFRPAGIAPISIVKPAEGFIVTQ